MHTVTGATSIAGLKKWAAQQPPQGADGAASAQYVAVASDACNIEFDFLGRRHAHTCRAGVVVPVAAAPGTCGSRRPRAGLRQSLGSEGSESHGRVGLGLGLGLGFAPCSGGAVQPRWGTAQCADFITPLRLTLQARCSRAGTRSCQASETSRGTRASMGCGLRWGPRGRGRVGGGRQDRVGGVVHKDTDWSD